MSLKDLQQYEKYFYRAPSAHNTQPWVLRYDQDVIDLSFDENRTLADGDPTRRDLLLSLGAFVETVLIVASHFKHDLEFITDIDLAKHRIGFFKQSAQPYETTFTLEDVTKRQTSRLIYKKDKINTLSDMFFNVASPIFKESNIKKLNRQSISPRFIKDLNVHSDAFQIQVLDSMALIDLFKISDHYVFHNIPVLKELRQWLRLSKSDPRYFKDGLNGECLNLSGFQTFVFEWILKLLESGYGQRLKLDKLLTSFSLDILKQRCDVFILIGENKGEVGALQAGRVLQRIWLTLAKEGYFTHPLSQIIDCPKTYALLSSRLVVEEKKQIFAVFRVGRSIPPAYSYRSH